MFSLARRRDQRSVGVSLERLLLDVVVKLGMMMGLLTVIGCF